MNDKKRVLIVTYKYPASDRRSWSGTSYSCKQELEKEFIVETYCINPMASLFALLKTFFYRKIKRSFIIIKMLKSLAKVTSKTVDRLAREKKCDCIIVMGTLASGAIAYSESSIPKVLVGDSVISQTFDYYYFNVEKSIAEEMNDVQRKALINSSAIVLTSDWAKKAAINDYEIDPDKINIFHLGANIEVSELKKEPHKGINLLFNGVEWERKGADVAIECVELLNKRDPDSHYTLHMVGCDPPRQIHSRCIRFCGFLNRNIKEERELLDHLREVSDFFILPTRAECAGLVFCEACAYGIPSITYDTGGIGDYIKNDINGYRLPVGSTAEDFANKIIEYVYHPEKVEEMKKNARHMYETDLNWEVMGNKLRNLVNHLTERQELV